MNKRRPSEKFTKEAEPFVEQIRELAKVNYQKLLTLSKDFGQKLQKTFNPTFGIGGTGTKSTVKRTEQPNNIKAKNDESSNADDEG